MNDQSYDQSVRPSEADEVVECYFIEGVHYTKDDLHAGLMKGVSRQHRDDVRNGRVAFPQVLESLLQYRFTDNYRQTSFTNALSRGANPNGEYYVFNFVGILTVRGYLFYVFPKFVKADKQGKFITPSRRSRLFMAQVIAVCDTYKRRQGMGAENTNSLVEESDELIGDAELYRALIEDFLHEGAYRSRRTVWERNGNTAIDWDRTIDQSKPIMTHAGTPLYADYWNRAKRDDSEALIRRLQLAWISHAAETFNRLQLLEDVLGYPSTLRNISNESPENIGTPEAITAILKRSRSREFSTRNRNLIGLLLLLTDQEETGALSTSHVISHLGTAPFENVWEDVCRTVFNNDQKMLDTLKRESRPAWSGTDHRSTRMTNMLIPDTICKVDDCDKWVIIDAKYYETTPDGGKNTPTRGPGIQNILKEYFYQLLMDGTCAPEKSAANVFMMPSQLNLQSIHEPDQTCRISGDIRFPFLQTLGLGTMGTTVNQHFLPIIYAELDACSAFQSYSQVSSTDGLSRQMDPQAILRTLVNYEEKATSIR